MSTSSSSILERDCVSYSNRYSNSMDPTQARLRRYRPYSKISGYGYRIRRVRVDASRIGKNKMRIQKCPDSVDGAFVRSLQGQFGRALFATQL